MVEIFNRPIEQQPRGICDMGCGDGALLEHLYSVVTARTTRGAVIEKPRVSRLLRAIEAIDGRKGIDSLARLSGRFFSPRCEQFSACDALIRCRYDRALERRRRGSGARDRRRP